MWKNEKFTLIFFLQNLCETNAFVAVSCFHKKFLLLAHCVIFTLFFENSQTFGTWSHWQRIRPDSWTLRGNVFQARNYCGLWWHSISLGPNARIGLYSSWDQKGLIAWQFILGQLLLRQSILKNWCKNSNFDLFWPNKFQF